MIKIDQEFWTGLGIQAGIVLLILIFTVLLAKIVKRILLGKGDSPVQKSIQFKFVAHFITGFIYFVGILVALYSIPAMRKLTTTFLASSGILAIIIGFASQQAFSNIVSGVFIAIFRPFQVGERLEFPGKNIIGNVEDITLRHTVIRTFDYKRVIIPNSVISSEILENAHIVSKNTIKFFHVGISYDSDIEKAMAIIKEEALKHPLCLDNRTEEEIAEGKEPVIVRVIGFGESSVNIKANVWAKNPDNAYIIGCDLNLSVKKRFDEEGIEIPFPYRTIVYKDETAPSATPTS